MKENQIWITGDTHGDISKFTPDVFYEQKDLGPESYLIITGDFGFIWNWRGEILEERKALDYINSCPYTTLFVDGNHENFDRLNSYPVEFWHGGKVHRIGRKIFHLMRGQVFWILDKKFFTFGGARSWDVSGGILNPYDKHFAQLKKEADKGEKPYRILGQNIWPAEFPLECEMNYGEGILHNEYARSNGVDFFISHDCPLYFLKQLYDTNVEADDLNLYLEKLRKNYQEKSHAKWIFGHHHVDQNLDGDGIAIYDQIIRIV